MADRKMELERKKAKLAAMREEKKKREDDKRRGGESNTYTAANETPDLRTEAEDILKNLGISMDSPQPVSLPATHGLSGTATDVDHGSLLNVSPRHAVSPKRQRKLQFSKLSQTTIPPREVVAYAKETQTKKIEAELEMLSYDERDNETVDATAALAELQKMPHMNKTAAATTLDEEAEERKDEFVVREMSDDEKLQVLLSETFRRSFDRSARIMERALAEEVDIFVDYSGAERDDEEAEQSRRKALKLQREFFDERWSRNRTVTCLDWSTIYPELCVASYDTNEDAPHEPDGVVLVWNTKFKKSTPEYIFHSQSAVQSVCFARFHPNLLVGGTYSGQMVLWDNRNNKRTPVQRTPLSAAAHTHPVYCVTVAGTQHAHNLISLSTDGKMCTWSLDMLSQPQGSMELQHRQAKAVAVTCFSFFANDVNNFVVGSEEGAVYMGCRHGSKTGISDVSEAHWGPVSGIDTHKTMGPVDFSHLYLSSSFDWTVKLWSNRETAIPLYSFEDSGDYVFDVQWSPVHPAVFAAVDGAGRLDVWNLNHETEVPAARVVTDTSCALNHCRWHESGLHLSAGDDQGRVLVYDVAETLAQPRADEWSQMARTIAEMRSSAAELRRDAEEIGAGNVGVSGAGGISAGSGTNVTIGGANMTSGSSGALGSANNTSSAGLNASPLR